MKLGALLAVSYRTGWVTQAGRVSAGDPRVSDKEKIGRIPDHFLNPAGRAYHDIEARSCKLGVSQEAGSLILQK